MKVSSTKEEIYDPPEKDSEEMNTSTETSSGTVDISEKLNMRVRIIIS